MAHIRIHTAPTGGDLAQPLAVPRLQHLPVPFFVVVMGLGGLALAWRRAEHLFALPVAVSAPLTALAAAVFAVLLMAYTAKAVRHRAAVAAEFAHPVRGSFFPTITISMLLLAIPAYDASPWAGHALWATGAVLHLMLTVVAMNRWIHHPGTELAHLNPAWFIPVVGNVLVPVLGVRLYPAEVSWFFFAVGIVLWLALLTLVLNRLFFHGPLPERLRMTLFILVAPPAIATVAWLALADVGPVAHILYSVALFFALLLLTNAPRFLRTRFYLSAWACSFPLAALTIASFSMAQRTGAFGYALIGEVALAVTTVVVAALAARTVLAVARREICVPE